MAPKSINSLPVNEKVFRIDVKGTTSGQNYTGEFTTVCMPTLRQKSQAAVMETRLNGDLQNLDSFTRTYNMVMAQLMFRLVEAPQWWIDTGNGEELLDANVVMEVWENCAKAEKEWVEKIWGKSKKEEKEIKASDEEDKNEAAA